MQVLERQLVSGRKDTMSTILAQTLHDTGAHPSVRLAWPPTAVGVNVTAFGLSLTDLKDPALQIGMVVSISDDGGSNWVSAGDALKNGWEGNPLPGKNGTFDPPAITYEPGLPPTVNGVQVSRILQVEIDMLTRAASCGVDAAFL